MSNLKSVSFWVIRFVTFRVPVTGYWFCLRVNQIRPAKSCSCLIPFVKVASGRFLVTCLYYEITTHGIKGKTLSDLLSACR